MLVAGSWHCLPYGHWSFPNLSGFRTARPICCSFLFASSRCKHGLQCCLCCPVCNLCLLREHPNPFPIMCVTSACLSSVPKKSFGGQCVQPVASGFQTSFELWQKLPVVYECHFQKHQALRWSSCVRWHLGRVPDIGLCSLICLLFYFLYSFSYPSSLAQALCGQFLGLVFCLFAGFLLHNPKSFQSLWVCGNPTVSLFLIFCPYAWAVYVDISSLKNKQSTQGLQVGFPLWPCR